MSMIKDVAQRANVSMATVSNVINNPAKVKDTTRARVLQAIADLNYEVDISEKEKRSKQLGTLGVIMEDIAVFNTPKIYTGICDAASEAGFNVLACNLGIVHNSQTLYIDEVICREAAQRAVNLLLSKNVNAIIYIGSQGREIRHITNGYSNGTPFVYAYCYSYDPNTASIIYDDEMITYQLITYLIENGHQKIGVIGGPQSGEHVRMRLSGYQRAMFDAKLLYNPNLLYFGDWENPDFGYQCIEPLLNQGISAVFCMNDMLAGGVIDYTHDHKINVPAQLSIVGFDNIAASETFYPKLTTVALPLNEIGRQAVVKAIKLLKTPKALADNDIVRIACSIVYRDSVANRLQGEYASREVAH